MITRMPRRYHTALGEYEFEVLKPYKDHPFLDLTDLPIGMILKALHGRWNDADHKVLGQGLGLPVNCLLSPDPRDAIKAPYNTSVLLGSFQKVTVFSRDKKVWYGLNPREIRLIEALMACTRQDTTLEEMERTYRNAGVDRASRGLAYIGDGLSLLEERLNVIGQRDLVRRRRQGVYFLDLKLMGSVEFMFKRPVVVSTPEGPVTVSDKAA